MASFVFDPRVGWVLWLYFNEGIGSCIQKTECFTPLISLHANPLV